MSETTIAPSAIVSDIEHVASEVAQEAPAAITTASIIEANASAIGASLEDIGAAGLAANQKPAPASDVDSLRARVLALEGTVNEVMNMIGAFNPTVKSIVTRIESLEAVVPAVADAATAVAPAVPLAEDFVQKVEKLWKQFGEYL